MPPLPGPLTSLFRTLKPVKILELPSSMVIGIATSMLCLGIVKFSKTALFILPTTTAFCNFSKNLI